MIRTVFWGVRGSVPAPGAQTAGIGGNTSCVEMRCGDTRLIFAAGSGPPPQPASTVSVRPVARSKASARSLGTRRAPAADDRGRLDRARTLYQAEFEKGDISAGVIMPLAKLNLQLGNVEQAIVLLERFVEQRPDHEAA